MKIICPSGKYNDIVPPRNLPTRVGAIVHLAWGVRVPDNNVRLLTAHWLLLALFIIAVHFGALEGFVGDVAVVEEAGEVGIPFDVAGAADDVFE